MARATKAAVMNVFKQAIRSGKSMAAAKNLQRAFVKKHYGVKTLGRGNASLHARAQFGGKGRGKRRDSHGRFA